MYIKSHTFSLGPLDESRCGGPSSACAIIMGVGGEAGPQVFRVPREGLEEEAMHDYMW